MIEEREQPEWQSFGRGPVRDRLIDALRIDLLGPERPDETLDQSPNTRYLVGMLAPAGTPINIVEDEDVDTVSGDEQSDSASVTYTSLDPSAIGLSILVADDTATVKVEATWGEYSRLDDDAREGGTEETDTTSGKDEAAGSTNRKPTRWQRTPKTFTANISTTATANATCVEAGSGSGVYLRWHARPLGSAVVLSVFLSNDRIAPEGRRPPDDQWIYQPSVRITTDGPRILGREIERVAADPDPDIASADLMYRRFHEYATGHGVSVDWYEPAPGDRADTVWTDVMPDREVPVVTHAQPEGVDPPEMDALADADAAALQDLLTPLLDVYERWIDDRLNHGLPSIAAPDDDVAADHLALAQGTLKRMRSGVALLGEQPLALLAFQFANRAMALQIRHSIQVRALRRGETPPEKGSIHPTWRPFQIGFILQCLPGIFDPDHDDRKVADLLWFPTGGGKTEAYLGLTAFTIALRRIRPATRELEAGGGLAVLMRYTLRLLTIQQFQRALTLICACEVLREASPETWGPHPFTIGLWVGQKAAPNSFKDSADALDKLREGKRVYQGSPYQIVYCPWCGEDLTPEDYVAERDLERTLVKCRNSECDFAASKSRLGLPLLVVDEEIYRNPPSLLLATVDKFAQMPWNGRVQALFGRVNRHCSRHGFLSAAESHPESHRETKGHAATKVTPVGEPLAPPELVIQDELHLISGPLGTLVGIYEVAVQELCRRGHQEKFGPKIIASTATVRRAARQVEALFGRDVEIFPPLGLDSDDSFFARRADPANHPGRTYLAVYAPGRSVKTALVRTYAALLSRAKVEFDEERTETADSYMTLVGYFNSLRELGGAVRLVEDDVPARLNVLRRRRFGPRRPIFEHQELTSRITSDEIPKRLKELERQFFDPGRGAYPIDVLLASNMLSVGVDIDRLGLMVVSGQPKTTAEYIQATSRVGRKHPGLVVIVYNWIRPRDTSHYETFRHYHDTFYRRVEATSVTPFSARARDRALPAVVASYVRLDTSDLVREADAAKFAALNESAERISESLLGRVARTTGRDDVKQDTEQQLATLRSEWLDAALDEDHPLVYTRRGLGKDESRANLLKPMGQVSGKGMWEAARSLREVEVEIDIVLKDTPGGT